MARNRNMKKYRSAVYNGERYYNVGHQQDGSLWNPNGYPETLVHEILEAVAERRRQRKADGIKKAVATRKARHERKIYAIALLILHDHDIGNRETCACCAKVLTDQESIDRGIGPECWQHVLASIQRQKDEVVVN